MFEVHSQECVGSEWAAHRMRYESPGAKVRDPYQLRVNAYRVLLTRGRDATMIYVPRLSLLDETYDHLVSSGVASVTASPA